MKVGMNTDIIFMTGSCGTDAEINSSTPLVMMTRDGAKISLGVVSCLQLLYTLIFFIVHLIPKECYIQLASYCKCYQMGTHSEALIFHFLLWIISNDHYPWWTLSDMASMVKCHLRPSWLLPRSWSLGCLFHYYACCFACLLTIIFVALKQLIPIVMLVFTN